MWALRIVWCTLPVTAGEAAGDALRGWSDGAAHAATVLLWIAWGVVVVAMFAPRPPGLAVLRTVAPVFAALALAALVAGEIDGAEGWGTVAATLVALGLAMLSDFAIAAANGIAYGDERRHPLRTPPALFAGPLPLARAAVAAGVATGPLLLADGEVPWGLLAIALGIPAVYLGSRALLTLVRRWVVLVPSGLVVVDPMTVTDSVLVQRRFLRALRAVGAHEVPSGSVDLRLGATAGSVGIELHQPIEVPRAERGRRSRVERTTTIVVAVAKRDELLREAAARGSSGQPSVSATPRTPRTPGTPPAAPHRHGD